MKYPIFLFLLLLLSDTNLQSQVTPIQEVSNRPSISMSEVMGSSKESGQYRFYLKGKDTPYTGVLFAKYPNGNYKSWQEYTDGIGQGVWINYYENGNYKEIGHYEQNRVEGPIKKYHPNGQLKASGTYKDWRIWIGKWSFYNQNGQLEKVEDYGTAGNFEEVEAYYQRGDIPYSWYQQILSQKQ